MNTASINNRNSRLDKLGIAAASICAVHCVLTPLFIGLLPMVGLARLADERTEWAFVAISVTLGVVSLLPGYWRHHRRPAPLGVFVVGVLLILSARFFLEDKQQVEIVVVVTGALFLAVGHGINCRQCRTCAVGQAHTNKAS